MATSYLTAEQQKNEDAAQAIRFGKAPATPSAPSGITTSADTEARVKAINETIASIQGGIDKVSGNTTTTDTSKSGSTPTTTTDGSNPFAALFERINVLQTNLNAAKEAEKLAKENLATADVNAKLASQTSAEEVGKSAGADLSAGVDAVGKAAQGQTTDTSTIEDPVIRALTDKSVANVSILNQQMQALNDYRSQFNEYTQQDIDSIARTAERAVNRQLAENDRVKRAMEFAGIVGGRAQFSPIIEETIINDVVQEGLDKIEVINEKKNTAIREARKAEADFNIDVFEQQANLAKEYNNEIESTISAMNAQVRQVEKDERERIDFRQSQEERASLILAEELVDATPEQVMQAAAANGIEPGLLAKAVNDAKFEKQNREFETQNQALTLEEKRASIAKSYNDIRLANEKAAATASTEPMSVSEINQFADRNGWVPPQGMSASTAYAINNGLMVFDEDVRQQYSTLRVTDPAAAQAYLDEQLNTVADVSIADKLAQDDLKGVRDLYEKAATEMGVAKVWNWGDFKEVAKTNEFKQAYKDVFTAKMSSVNDASGSMFATDEQFLKEVLDKTLELNTANKKELAKLKEAVLSSENKTANSTPAINF